MKWEMKKVNFEAKQEDPVGIPEENSEE